MACNRKKERQAVKELQLPCYKDGAVDWSLDLEATKYGLWVERRKGQTLFKAASGKVALTYTERTATWFAGGIEGEAPTAMDALLRWQARKRSQLL